LSGGGFGIPERSEPQGVLAVRSDGLFCNRGGGESVSPTAYALIPLLDLDYRRFHRYHTVALRGG
jgi:hypothetical protein